MKIRFLKGTDIEIFALLGC